MNLMPFLLDFHLSISFGEELSKSLKFPYPEYISRNSLSPLYTWI